MFFTRFPFWFKFVSYIVHLKTNLIFSSTKGKNWSTEGLWRRGDGKTVKSSPALNVGTISFLCLPKQYPSDDSNSSLVSVEDTEMEAYDFWYNVFILKFMTIFPLVSCTFNKILNYSSSFVRHATMGSKDTGRACKSIMHTDLPNGKSGRI